MESGTPASPHSIKGSAWRDRFTKKSNQAAYDYFNSSPERATAAEAESVADVSPGDEAGMEALLEAKNQELYELQQALLDSPRKQRKEMKQRVEALDTTIDTLCRAHQLLLEEAEPSPEPCPALASTRIELAGQPMVLAHIALALISVL